MKDRTFISGSESPRLYSEVRFERGIESMDRVFAEIARLEAEAAAAETDEERKRLQCEAEGYRAALHEQRSSR